jgi:hypothetical protein
MALTLTGVLVSVLWSQPKGGPASGAPTPATPA